ncbi:Hypothetical predicted protein [Cloeon dipterum]|uniref:Uncharacterized protein n=1 Tax=Cloeon dipterum TaxID=197152 RepID=A0A8S1CJU1_9INSE|nr:Hypothetical predicted protein [Cloeon dipterum]
MEGFGTENRLFDPNTWDYYSEGLSGRLLDRNQLTGEAIITPSSLLHHASTHPSYRPWESKLGGAPDPELLKAHAAAASGLADAFSSSKLPSFQSQFTTAAFNEPVTNNGGGGGGATVVPADAAPGLPSFHTLTPATTGGAPPPPRGFAGAGAGAREIPQIQQQMMDERHIQLFHSQPGFQPNQFSPPPPPHHHHPVRTRTFAAYHPAAATT